MKDTHLTTIGVKENRFFSVNIPSVDMIQKTDYCGLISGKTTDKSQLFSSFYDGLGKAPMISECPMNFLCKVVQTVPVCGFEVFFGEIVSTFVNKQCLTDGNPDPSKINPTLLMGFNYYSLGESVGGVYKEGKKIDIRNQ